MILLERTGPIEAELTDENPRTAAAVLAALPLKGRVNRWGDEIFFTVPFQLETEHGRKEVDVGEVAFWPDGDGFCVFFGPTPISDDSGRPRAYSPVNVFAKLVTDTKPLLDVQSGDEITVMPAEAYSDELLFEWEDLEH